MRRLPLAFFLLLAMASMIGLAAAWTINVTLFGRPQSALLQLLVETAAAGINCEQPELSPLFRFLDKTQDASLSLHYVLLDSEGHQLGHFGQVPAGFPQALSPESHSIWNKDKPWRASSVWVKVTNVCEKNWSLWAWDPNNETYRRMLLPRQIILVFSCSSSIIGVVLIAAIFVRRKGFAAHAVLSKIVAGEFGCRIPQTVWEPRLQLISEFNRMAEAVEESFLRLHQMEERRSRLLSELAHDIRTPLASVRAAAETLSEFHCRMSDEQRQTLQQTLLLDVIYFQRLTDDLLILAQIDRFDTLAPQQSTELLGILKILWQRMVEQYPTRAYKFEVPNDQSELWIPGDEALVRRLLQNTLDNAFHYAQSWVTCRIEFNPKRICLNVTNDAVRLSAEELQNWGHKRRQRIITEKAGQPHTSLGLGSSIIVGVARHLGGSARVEQNILDLHNHAKISVIIDIPRIKSF